MEADVLLFWKLWCEKFKEVTPLKDYNIIGKMPVNFQ